MYYYTEVILIFFLFSVLIFFSYFSVSVVHEDFYVMGCSDKEKEHMYGMDGEELYHSDFIKGVGVDTLPEFSDPMTFPGFYDQGLSEMQVCKANLDVAIKAYKNPQEKMGRIWNLMTTI